MVSEPFPLSSVGVPVLIPSSTIRSLFVTLDATPIESVSLLLVMIPWPLMIRYYHPVWAICALCYCIAAELGSTRFVSSQEVPVHAFDTMRAGGRERRIPPDLTWQLLGANPQYVGWTIPFRIVQPNLY
ncbi:unnamed protein product (mitochondrion) [Plasmodiophora brassicae]|uniref:Uncharacterized protein n=1 Tax=Plasmodiophora brassicae TaxID=37360 RepID=A0A3P3Y3E8_PLABS|nr:unnamed protein product [Plasmodiophora brassicae]